MVRSKELFLIIEYLLDSILLGFQSEISLRLCFYLAQEHLLLVWEVRAHANDDADLVVGLASLGELDRSVEAWLSLAGGS